MVSPTTHIDKYSCLTIEPKKVARQSRRFNDVTVTSAIPLIADFLGRICTSETCPRTESCGAANSIVIRPVRRRDSLASQRSRNARLGQMRPQCIYQLARLRSSRSRVRYCINWLCQRSASGRPGGRLERHQALARKRFLRARCSRFVTGLRK